ncbi:unnamed protein product [Effrenium voratum]|uniref:ubiquitinyl hydrolase 1 n=1 Tax=Effrenium voratum TaxID=2562239 RepID=A0AA36MZQ5_9DINO|nr:unnamed protein product [Effrenium voratum]
MAVLQLKRFHTSEGASYKLFNEVVFGQTLDLKDFLCDGGKACHKTETFVDWHRPLRERSWSDEMRRWAGFPGLSREVTKYQLYGVVNHIGGMGSGHYTACILHDKQWYCFNDDRVYTISDQDVCSANAYLLFYARSDVAEGQKDFSQLFPPEGRQVKAANLEQIKQSTWVSDLHRASSKGTAASGDRFCAVS